MYAARHGPAGLKAIAERVHALTALLARGLQKLGVRVKHQSFFDTLRSELEPAAADRAISLARDRRMNPRRIDNRSIGISLDETTRPEDLQALWAVFAGDRPGGLQAGVAGSGDAGLASPRWCGRALT